MNVRFRIFWVGDDDSIRRIAVQSFNDFYLKQKPALPQFSNTTITVASVACKFKGRMATEIVKIDCMRVKVGPDGSLDEDSYRDTLRLIGRQISGPSAKTGPGGQGVCSLVDAADKFDERRWAQLHPELSGPALKQILQALFG
jgi:hypothetical protein